MATLQFQRQQLIKELCVIELKLQALSGKEICDIALLKQLQDDQARHRQLLQMIDQHLDITDESSKKT